MHWIPESVHAERRPVAMTGQGLSSIYALPLTYSRKLLYVDTQGIRIGDINVQICRGAHKV